ANIFRNSKIAVNHNTVITSGDLGIVNAAVQANGYVTSFNSADLTKIAVLAPTFMGFRTGTNVYNGLGYDSSLNILSLANAGGSTEISGGGGTGASHLKLTTGKIVLGVWEDRDNAAAY